MSKHFSQYNILLKYNTAMISIIMQCTQCKVGSLCHLFVVKGYERCHILLQKGGAMFLKLSSVTICNMRMHDNGTRDKEYS